MNISPFSHTGAVTRDRTDMNVTYVGKYSFKAMTLVGV